jgi:chloramphenicol-sensitive protein RarD
VSTDPGPAATAGDAGGGTATTEQSELRHGLVYGATAYLLWGLFPLYWPLLEPAKPLEILAQRMSWSMVVVGVILLVTGGVGRVRAIYADRRRRSLLLVAAVCVTINWGTYIWGVNTHHVVETSLGYFINPLFTILLGVFVLGERLRRMQWVAVGIGAIAVLVIAIDYGRPPWIALVLATSFGLYGFTKKQAGVGAVESMAVETSAMFLPAVIALGVIGAQGHLAFGRHGVGNTLLLAGTGVVTVVPLLFFAAGTTRLPLSVLGLLQYLAPVLQFAVGIGIRHESTPAAELVGFCLVWVALVLLTVDGLRSQRAGTQAARAAESAAV